jgi:hypothetical protein
MQLTGQCEFALMAAEDINAALKNVEAKNDRLWFSLNAFLTAVANVSKMLWPNPNRKTAKQFPDRGTDLRKSLGVSDDSPLQHRRVRNHFEHIDERVEEWWLESERHNIALRIIGPLGGVIEGLDEKEFFEQFDPGQPAVAFQGDIFELQPIATEVADLLGRLREAERKERDGRFGN